ncbi:hypothetical protein SAMN02745216_03572 [Desulfatibacillum alkenivorans DSM 16219]|jgi:REP element-mobilizing transposase RayT|uniref:Transposase IS200-like domain-containing protein n=1 Tax=Desulfatibacillum alkenivorans DSM 16219 TaxID=1121393 RepID=A0A1M6T220_9BACT|nr:transposase [Desulfatibacillum alkenivorans]SHK51005.1 hypothetical protein SAMN02745216_03572 [Desulfatibacillum alkenivorans DSM 16219]
MDNPQQRGKFRSLRLKRYDYSRPGAYFVTICERTRKNLFGRILKSKMALNRNGEIVQQIWDALPDRFQNLRLDTFVIMPNHVHGFLIFPGQVYTTNAENPTNEKNYIDDMSQPCSAVNKDFRDNVGAGLALHSGKACLSEKDSTEYASSPGGTTIKSTQGANQRYSLGDVVRVFKSISTLDINRFLKKSGPVWQRNYYEHVIRNPQSLNAAREYIRNNPKNWKHDKENPGRHEKI